MYRFIKFILIILFSICCTDSFAANHVINLVVSYKTVTFAGKTSKAIVVNNQIPAPTLHFKEGDQVTINVHNLLDKETAIHWHGILVPWQMDGVLGISQQGIPPGGTFHYQFTLHQSGTYWYHAHAGLEEQQGLYGAFLIDPLTQPNYHYTKDYVIVLSDWINTNPEQVLANLKKEGDYYSPRFPLQPSLAKFMHDYRNAAPSERKELIKDYQMMQQMRMGIYDLSDVAYDAFLLNGQSKSNPWTAKVQVGDIVRLRFIGASGGTLFQIKIPNSTMQMVHVEGNDIKPFTTDHFTIAPGETYDVLVKIEKNQPYIIYAESIDKVGAAYGALLTQPKQIVNYSQITAFPDPLPVTRTMQTMMMSTMESHDMPVHNSMQGMKMEPGTSMNHSMNHSMNMPMKHELSMDHSMSMSTESSIIGDKISPPHSSYTTSSGTKYEKMTAALQTNDPNKPIAGIINMELFGYMDRFIWFINGVPEYKAKPLILDPGKRYRFVFTNTSMMHHPMHIHGHWFILRKGNNAYDPLLHTIDVPPGATITADVDTDASGQWFFHCHLVYHMISGMGRVIQYSTLIDIMNGKAAPQNSIKETLYYNRPIVRVDEVRPLDFSLIKHPMAHSPGIWLATFLEMDADPFHHVQSMSYKGLYGSDYNKLELFTNDAEIDKGTVDNADIDIFYWHLIDQFWAIKGGVNYFDRPAQKPYWQPGLGIEGLMPYFIDTDVRGYWHSGSTKLDVELSRDTQITNRFFIQVGTRCILASKTVTDAQIGNGLNQMRYMIRPNYQLMPGLNVYVEYEYEKDYGEFKTLQVNAGDSATQNTYSVGLAMVF